MCVPVAEKPNTHYKVGSGRRKKGSSLRRTVSSMRLTKGPKHCPNLARGKTSPDQGVLRTKA